MGMTVNIGGVEKTVSGVYVNVDGVWKTASKVLCNIGGVWKDGYTSGIGGIDAYTKLMMHGNGTDGSTTFTDSSASPKTFTAYGNARIRTAESKFGGAAMYFDGTGDWIDTPDSADFALGNSDFTIDFWMKRDAINVLRYVFGQSNSSQSAASTSVVVYIQSNNIVNFTWSNGSSTFNLASSATISDTNWHHIAIVRTTGYFYIYIDGAQSGSYNIGTAAINNSANKFAIGRFGEYTGTPFAGYIDEFRYRVGDAAWTSNFTPPPSEYTT